ncbi:unnamed protein product [Ectocarpus sp. CCAP 1310/34]|nr:unnamed protein product [Ectocarpus sp. CCAP 1310/34]
MYMQRHGSTYTHRSRPGESPEDSHNRRNKPTPSNAAAIKTALADMEPLLGKVGGSEKLEWSKKKEENACKTAERNSKASGLALHKEMTECHAEFSKKIVEEEKQKEAGYQMRVRFLRKMFAGIEKEMFGDE